MSELDMSLPLLSQGFQERKRFGVEELLSNGPAADYALRFCVVLTSFLANYLNPAPAFGWLLFVALLFLVRTDMCPPWKVAIVVLVCWFLPILSYPAVHKLMLPMHFLLIVIFSIALAIDKVIVQKTFSWAVRAFKSLPSQRSAARNSFLWLRIAVCALFFPCFYAGIYHVLFYLPKPFHVVSCTEVAYMQIDTPLAMLASVGGTPLVSFTVILSASVLTLIFLAMRLQRRGVTFFMRQPDIHGRATATIIGGSAAASSSMSRMMAAETQSIAPSSSPYWQDDHVTSSGYSRSDEESPAHKALVFEGIGALLLKALVPVVIATLALLAAGPLAQGLFDGRFLWTTIDQLSAGLTVGKMGCAPRGLTEEIVAQGAAENLTFLMSGECQAMSAHEAAGLSKKYNMTLGVGFTEQVDETVEKSKALQRNLFSIVDPQGTLIYTHEKFQPVPLIENLVEVKSPKVTQRLFDFDAKKAVPETSTTSKQKKKAALDTTNSESNQTSEDAASVQQETGNDGVGDDGSPKSPAEQLQQAEDAEQKPDTVEETNASPDTQTDSDNPTDAKNEKPLAESKIPQEAVHEQMNEVPGDKVQEAVAGSSGDEAQNVESGTAINGTTRGVVVSSEIEKKDTEEIPKEEAKEDGGKGEPVLKELGGSLSLFGSFSPLPSLSSAANAHPGRRISRLGTAICFDMYNAGRLSDAGRQGVELMVSPSFIWGPLHSNHESVNRIRAIENNFVLMTCTYDGISGAYGPFGEIYAKNFRTDGLIVYDVPIRPQTNAWDFFRWYPWVGSTIGWSIFFAGIGFGVFGVLLPG